MSNANPLPSALEQLLEPDFFKSLSDPVRLQVVVRLLCATEPQTVTEVQGCCGVHLSGVSRHLAALKAVGIVEAAKSGREVRYSLRASDLSRRLRALADAIEAAGHAQQRQDIDCSGPRECGPAGSTDNESTDGSHE